jgi:hypothetical protein
VFEQNRLAEDKPSGYKYVQYIKKIKNLNINLVKVHFVRLYCIIMFILLAGQKNRQNIETISVYLVLIPIPGNNACYF